MEPNNLYYVAYFALFPCFFFQKFNKSMKQRPGKKNNFLSKGFVPNRFLTITLTFLRRTKAPVLYYPTRPVYSLHSEWLSFRIKKGLEKSFSCVLLMTYLILLFSLGKVMTCYPWAYSVDENIADRSSCNGTLSVNQLSFYSPSPVRTNSTVPVSYY